MRIFYIPKTEYDKVALKTPHFYTRFVDYENAGVTVTKVFRLGDDGATIKLVKDVHNGNWSYTIAYEKPKRYIDKDVLDGDEFDKQLFFTTLYEIKERINKIIELTKND